MKSDSQHNGLRRVEDTRGAQRLATRGNSKHARAAFEHAGRKQTTLVANFGSSVITTSANFGGHSEETHP